MTRMAFGASANQVLAWNRQAASTNMTEEAEQPPVRVVVHQLLHLRDGQAARGGDARHLLGRVLR